MPRKIRQLLQDYMKNGGSIRKSGGKGSHRKVTHEKLDRTIIVSGKDGEDAMHYQEKDLKEFLRKIK